MRQDDDYRRGGHVVSALNVHLVFVTKYRRGVLTGEHLDTLGEVFASVCADVGAELVEMDGEDDHVHLLDADPPHVAVARLVNSLQGRLGSAATPTLPGAHPPGAPVVPVVLRGLGWWRTAGDLRAYIRQQRTPGRLG
jgi:putative transposase